MLRNYLLTARRNLLRNKAFSLINIAGLAIGLTCCLLLLLYVQHELSFDKFHSKSERIARVIMQYTIGDHGNEGAFTSTKVFPEFKRQFAEVENGVRISDGARLIKYKDEVFQQEDFLFADSTFFEVFDFTLINGNPKTVLEAPRQIVLSRSVAQKIFGKEDPIGKTLLIGSRQEGYEVTGVSEDCPDNSQIKYSAVASISSFGPLQTDRYSEANYTTYLLLNSSTAFNTLEGKIAALLAPENATNEFKVHFTLEPLTRVHLHSPYDAFVPNSSVRYIYIIVAIAILILAIACFTYINLSTARSAGRAKEVGIRKVSGAFKGQLFWQFITESFIITLIALFISLLLTLLVLPSFNSLANVELQPQLLLQPGILLSALSLVSVIALFAGSYPAVMMSRFEPVQVLKGIFSTGRSGVSLRQGLIIFQFVISAFLIISTLLIRSQLQFIQQKKLGYNREHIISADLDGKMIDKIDVIKKEVASIPGVSAASLCYESPVLIKGGYNMSGSNTANSMAVTANPIDENYLQVNGLELIAGNNITAQHVKDASTGDSTASYHFILNASAALALGWKAEEAIGKRMYLGESRPGIVQGVVADFHFASLHTPIAPLVLFPSSYGSVLLIKSNGKNLPVLLASLQDKWKEIAPHRPFTYHFLDDEYQRLYTAEMRMGKVFNVFAGLAIILASLGLFGLSAYATRQRVKEIGVRKVLGASVAQISWLLSTGFIKLVLLSLMIAGPLALLAMSTWLNQFSYRVSVSWLLFVYAGIICISTALLTVGLQALKAAMANPVKSLRTE